MLYWSRNGSKQKSENIQIMLFLQKPIVLLQLRYLKSEGFFSFKEYVHHEKIEIYNFGQKQMNDNLQSGLLQEWLYQACGISIIERSSITGRTVSMGLMNTYCNLRKGEKSVTTTRADTKATKNRFCGFQSINCSLLVNSSLTGSILYYNIKW